MATTSALEQENRFFPGDVITLKAKAGAFGSITRVNWLPDSDDEHWEYFDYVDEDIDEPLQDGHVEVLWNDSLKLSQVSTSRISVVDRGFVHGDIIASADDPTGQTCTVVDVILTVDLKMERSKAKIPNVSPVYLTDIHPFMIGRHVTKKDQKQVGTIDDVICDVEVRFNDRTKCILHKATPKTLKILEDDVSDDEVEPERNYLYYPSQQVAATQQVWDAAEWLTKRKPVKNQRAKKKKERISGIVTKVTPVEVVVYWHGGTEIEESTQNSRYDDHEADSYAQIGDLTMINPHVKNYFLERAKANPQQQQPTKKGGKGKGKGGKGKGKGAKGGKGKSEEEEEEEVKTETATTTTATEELTQPTAHISNIVEDHAELIAQIAEWSGTDEECAMITATHTHVRVKWQDGTVDPVWHPSTDFVPRKYLLDCEFLPGKFVRLEDKDATGIIKKVNPKDKMATIQWILPNGEYDEEDLSVYDIMERQDKKFRLGGVVKSVGGDRVGEVVNVEGNKIEVVWSDNQVTTAILDDLQAVDTDDEDEGLDDDETEEEAATKDIVIEDLPDEAINAENTATFRQLDSCAAHEYLNHEQPAKITRIAAREWKRLQEGLIHEQEGTEEKNEGGGIYVVAYNQRMDLMKALIVGPSETVFYNSYFLFDLALPKGYPHYPPKVFFCSQTCTGQMNPNLKADGTVCLSLLGTWSGDGSERWHPNRSSVLQLLVSLQGLVLGVKEPYFLEAGYDKLKTTKQGEQNSKMFNEKALVLSLRNVLKIYQNPPEEFRDVITKQFYKGLPHAHKLGEACTRMLNGEAETPEDKNIKQLYCLHENPSRGFLTSIVKLLQNFPVLK